MDLQRKLDFIENYRTALELLKHKEMRIDYHFPAGNGVDALGQPVQVHFCPLHDLQIGHFYFLLFVLRSYKGLLEKYIRIRCLLQGK